MIKFLKEFNPQQQSVLIKSSFSKHQSILLSLGMRPDNPAFFDIRYPAGYQIELPDIR
jgi:hypothetical protein